MKSKASCQWCSTRLPIPHHHEISLPYLANRSLRHPQSRHHRSKKRIRRREITFPSRVDRMPIFLRVGRLERRPMTAHRAIAISRPNLANTFYRKIRIAHGHEMYPPADHQQQRLWQRRRTSHDSKRRRRRNGHRISNHIRTAKRIQRSATHAVRSYGPLLEWVPLLRRDPWAGMANQHLHPCPWPPQSPVPIPLMIRSERIRLTLCRLRELPTMVFLCAATRSLHPPLRLLLLRAPRDPQNRLHWISHLSRFKHHLIKAMRRNLCHRACHPLWMRRVSSHRHPAQKHLHLAMAPT
jgi:hypothetical protein